MTEDQRLPRFRVRLEYTHTHSTIRIFRFGIVFTNVQMHSTGAFPLITLFARSRVQGRSGVSSVLLLVINLLTTS